MLSYITRAEGDSLYKTIITGMLLALAVGFKEPFLLSCTASALLIDSRPQILWRRLAIPAVIAALLIVTVLSLLGALWSYFSLYLPALVLFRVGSMMFTPLWVRGFSIARIAQDLYIFSSGMPVFVLTLIAGQAALRFIGDHQMARVMSYLTGLALSLYLVVFSVAIGGDFQGHHFGIATPFYFSALLLFIREVAQNWSRPLVRRFFAASVLLAGVMLLFTMKEVPLRLGTRTDEQSARQAAIAIDSILDRCRVERYLLISGPGLRLFGFTKHSPLNHSLYFQIEDAIQYGERFAEIAIDRLSRASILIVHEEGFTPTNYIGNVMAQYILQAFSPDPVMCSGPLPRIPGYFPLFRRVYEPLRFSVTLE